MSVEVTHGLILDKLVGNVAWDQLTRTRFVWVRASASGGRTADRKWVRHRDQAAEHGLSVATIHEADLVHPPEEQAAAYLPHLVGKSAVLRLDRGWDEGVSGFGYHAMLDWVDRYDRALPRGVTLRVIHDPYPLQGMLEVATGQGREVAWTAAVVQWREHAPTANDLTDVVAVAGTARRAGTHLTHWLWADQVTIRQATGPVGRVVRIRHS